MTLSPRLIRILEIALADNVGAAELARALAPEELITLTDAPAIVWDASASRHFIVTLAGNRFVEAPTDLIPSCEYYLTVVQDAVGSRLLSYDETGFEFQVGVMPELPTAANSKTIVKFYSDGSVLKFMSMASNLLGAPNAPSNLIATDGVGQISFTWTDNSTVETTYRVTRFNGLSWDRAGDEDLPAGTEEFIDIVEPGTYQYRVVALKGTVSSSPSNEVTGISSEE